MGAQKVTEGVGSRQLVQREGVAILVGPGDVCAARSRRKRKQQQSLTLLQRMRVQLCSAITLPHTTRYAVLCCCTASYHYIAMRT